MRKKLLFVATSLGLIACCIRCSPGGNAGTSGDIEFWLTKPDQTVLLQKQAVTFVFGTDSNNNANIEVDSTQSFQKVEGFGYTLTGASAQLINAMEAAKKAALLRELFGTGDSSIGISYLRLSIGASDLNLLPFTYDDPPAGKTDTALAAFKLDPDQASGTGLIPLLREVLKINPAIKIIAAPWSPPVWMKDNNSFTGGSLQPKYYGVYAAYFVKYIQQMKAEGIVIDAITPQNEPLNPNNTPSLLMTAEQQRDFIKNSLGPAFQKAGLATKIVVYDHNCDRPDYVTTILQDESANSFVYGSAFHLYGGDISALTAVHNSYPGKALYFTEQWTAGSGKFNEDLPWHVKNVVIGSMRNWSLTALEWNLANDTAYSLHTPGGCTECRGAITINGSAIQRNVAYYIIGHTSKFVPAGSVRIASNNAGNLSSVAFSRSDGKKVLVVVNDDSTATTFNLKYKSRWVTPSLPAGSVGTFVW